MFKNVTLSFFFLLSAIFVVGTACDDDTYYYQNDYSDVPDLADIDTAITSWVTENGLTIYVMETGDSTGLQVGIRDNISVYITSRNASVDNYETNEDAILQSSYANGITTPTTLSGLSSQTTIYYVSTTLGDGLYGMYEGEHRILYYPDSLTTLGQPMVIDVELDEVEY